MDPRPVPGPPRPAPTTPAGAGVPAEVPAVAAALAALQGVEARPLDEHVEVFDQVHRLLQDALASLDER